MTQLYDDIGKGYSTGRKTDPIIAAQLHHYLEGAACILNVGAGTGSYEPTTGNLTAIEPSQEMINQRPVGAHRVMQASAESLPFGDQSFSHTMTVLSMHHWQNHQRAFDEIKRVTRERFVALTWNPDAPAYWLTRDYFPEIHAIDQSIFPSLTKLEHAFGGIQCYPLPIPAQCIDGFTAAYWSRPHAYLDTSVRNSMSTFSKIKNAQEGIDSLANDLESGEWQRNYGHLLELQSLDVGYTIAVWDA